MQTESYSPSILAHKNLANTSLLRIEYWLSGWGIMNMVLGLTMLVSPAFYFDLNFYGVFGARDLYFIRFLGSSFTMIGMALLWASSQDTGFQKTMLFITHLPYFFALIHFLLEYSNLTHAIHKPEVNFMNIVLLLFAITGTLAYIFAYTGPAPLPTPQQERERERGRQKQG